MLNGFLDTGSAPGFVLQFRDRFFFWVVFVHWESVKRSGVERRESHGRRSVAEQTSLSHT